MYCPLCKAQYRVGYDLCRGCDADLVFTKEQADAENVVLFLESANLTGVGELADALKEANVPNHLRFEKAKSKDPLMFVNATAAKQQPWQIFVLDSDLDRARQVASAARFAGRYPIPGEFSQAPSHTQHRVERTRHRRDNIAVQNAKPLPSL
jgi:hypothetical protein